MSDEAKYRINIGPNDGLIRKWFWRVQVWDDDMGWWSIDGGPALTEERAERKALAFWNRYKDNLAFTAERTRIIDLG